MNNAANESDSTSRQTGIGVKNVDKFLFDKILFIVFVVLLMELMMPILPLPSPSPYLKQGILIYRSHLLLLLFARQSNFAHKIRYTWKPV